MMSFGSRGGVMLEQRDSFEKALTPCPPMEYRLPTYPLKRFLRTRRIVERNPVGSHHIAIHLNTFNAQFLS